MKDERMEEEREESECALCNKAVGETSQYLFKGMAVMLLNQQGVDRFTTFSPDRKHKAITLCDRAGCLKDLLDRMLLNEGSWREFFRDTKKGVGGWPGPGGCVHYLKTVWPTGEDARGWMESPGWAFSIKELVPEIRELWERAFEIYDKVEPRPPLIFLEGCYGGLMDGCYYFCSALCALTNLFPGLFPVGHEEFLAGLLSCSGMPNLFPKLQREAITNWDPNSLEPGGLRRYAKDKRLRESISDFGKWTKNDPDRIPDSDPEEEYPR